MKKKFQVTNFVERQFNPKFSGTKILNMSSSEFEISINAQSLFVSRDGYSSFCKLFTFDNFTNSNTGTLPISLENYQYLRCGYFSRTPDELLVLERWFELPIPAPKANHLIVVAYKREQLLKEFEQNKKEGQVFELSKDTEYGIVAILGQMHAGDEPMKPITMMRNALGISEGGSGVKLDKQKYQESVDFWSKHATVK